MVGTCFRAWRAQLLDLTAKAIAEIVRVIKQGGWHRALSERLTELEAKQDTLTPCLSETPQDVPDIHLGIAVSSASVTIAAETSKWRADVDDPENYLLWVGWAA